MSRLPQPPVLLITDRLQAAAPLVAIIEGALDGGCRWISVREKGLTDGKLSELVGIIRPLVAARGGMLSLHGQAAQVAAFGLTALHLSSGSNAAEARAMLGKDALIGQSIHTLEQAQSLDPQVLDYAILGPAFETVSKPGYGPALGINGVSHFQTCTPVPLIAVGGIDPPRAADLAAAGAQGIAVMGGIMRALDPALEMAAFVRAVRR